MIATLSDILFGCLHENTSFPQGRDGVDCHINCLDCGREFSYDFQRMEVVGVIKKESVIDESFELAGGVR